MQGRLSRAPAGRAQSFPFATWRAEFEAAAAIGAAHLEWLVTAETDGVNPLFDDRGIDAITAMIAATGVGVPAVCADFLIAEPLVRTSPGRRQIAIDRLGDLAARGGRIGAAVIVVPILENGEARTVAERREVAEALAPVLGAAAARGQRLAIESQMPVEALLDLIERCGPATSGACYDVGNATAAGFDAAADIRQLGRSVIAVHLKDRLRGGGSVPLGAGHVDFDAVFEALAAIGFAGPMTLETPAGGDPRASALRHLQFVRQRARSAAPARR
jgi:L-ribulose-5-phosphate 3-epimerase